MEKSPGFKGVLSVPVTLIDMPAIPFIERFQSAGAGASNSTVASYNQTPLPADYFLVKIFRRLALEVPVQYIFNVLFKRKSACER